MPAKPKTPPKVWKGVDSIRRLLVPITDISPHPKNPRRGDIGAIAESLERFGQMKPIVVWKEQGWIVAGNHTYLAAGESLGWTHIAAVLVPMEEDEALAYLMADNRTADLGRYDDDARLSILTVLSERGKLVGTGYSPDDVDDLIAERSRILEAERQPFEGGFSETDEELARREARRAEGLVLREVVLMMSVEDYEQFGVFVRMLKKDLGTDGVAETVFAALRKLAETL